MEFCSVSAGGNRLNVGSIYKIDLLNNEPFQKLTFSNVNALTNSRKVYAVKGYRPVSLNELFCMFLKYKVL
jgi:hypothetical protein